MREEERESTDGGVRGEVAQEKVRKRAGGKVARRSRKMGEEGE